MKPVRTRYAPSPTGFQHVGGIRTALFAWLVARQNNGQFILRFEDTDKKRQVEGAGEHLIKSLRDLGIEYDEGPDIGGPHGPYTQSERLDTYKQWAQKLIEAGRAYADPYTPEEVQKFREQAQAEKRPFLYRNHRPESPPTWDGSQPLRFKSDPEYLAHFSEQGPVVDLVMGELTISPEATDDFVLMKSDGFPTYNFAHIIDDHEMEITHVIRGQEFLSSMPGYVDLYNALGFERPNFAHLPHILNEQGNKKLGKRDGAKDVLDYIREGYLPEALRSFIATLGWNDGTTQEVYTTDELIQKFSLERVGRSGAHFDEKRLMWVNGSFIRALDIETMYTRCQEYWPTEATDANEDYKKRVLSLVQERLKYFAELPELTVFFFKDLPVNPELISGDKQLSKLDSSEIKSLLEQAKATIGQSDFSVQDLTERLNKLLEATGQKPGILFSLIRIATTQAPSSPGLADTLSVMGKETSLRRINDQLESIS